MIINVFGPPASGKTRYKLTLQEFYKASRIIDGFHKGKKTDDQGQIFGELMDGDLVLSHEPLVIRGRTIRRIPIEAALRDIRK